MCQEMDTPKQSMLAHLYAQHHTYTHVCSVHSAALTVVCLHVFVCVRACRWSIRGEAVARRWDHHDQRWTCQFGSQRTSHRPRQVDTKTLMTLWSVRIKALILQINQVVGFFLKKYKNWKAQWTPITKRHIVLLGPCGIQPCIYLFWDIPLWGFFLHRNTVAVSRIYLWCSQQ